MPKRCSWVREKNPLYVAYHDEEWGRACHTDQALFELLVLESFQAGLSWETVLNKREAFRQAFHKFDIDQVAAMTDEDLEALLVNPAIIRHRGKIWAARTNAQLVQRLQKEFGSFDAYVWSWVDGQTRFGDVLDYRQVPAQTPLSQALSKDLKKRGSSFTGPTTMQSFLQAAGLINDHENTCDFK